MNAPDLCYGPIAHGTLVAHCADTVTAAYADSFGFRIVSEHRIGAGHAAHWGLPALEGRRMITMSSASGASRWLRIIEVPGCAPAEPLRRHGWMALEVNVRDVDLLAVRLRAPGSAFRIIGEPAFLDFSDKIRAMQVVGPAGEVLYLTEVRAAVPPFELPQRPEDPVERLFIAVLSVPERDSAVRAYQPMAARQALCIDTRITVLNGAFGRPVEQRYPIAVLQLAGSALIEIDEVSAAAPAHNDAGGLAAGIAIVSFAVSGAPAGGGMRALDAPGYEGSLSVLRRGAAGEWIELIAHPA